jgi:hypothetical protein
MEEFRADLLKLPQDVRRSRMRSILRKEARNFARRFSRSEKGSVAKGEHTRSVRGGTQFLSLYHSIVRRSNRKNKEMIYEVVGTLSVRRGGAFYAIMQNQGKEGYPPTGEPAKRGQISYSGKRFLDKADRARNNGPLIKKIDRELLKVANKHFVARKA